MGLAVLVDVVLAHPGRRDGATPLELVNLRLGLSELDHGQATTPERGILGRPGDAGATTPGIAAAQAFDLVGTARLRIETEPDHGDPRPR